MAKCDDETRKRVMKSACNVEFDNFSYIDDTMKNYNRFSTPMDKNTFMDCLFDLRSEIGIMNSREEDEELGHQSFQRDSKTEDPRYFSTILILDKDKSCK